MVDGLYKTVAALQQVLVPFVTGAPIARAAIVCFRKGDTNQLIVN
jgi:hypothetical protein